MESCIADAKAQGKSESGMLGAKKQKAWLSDQSFAKKFGFETVDETENGCEGWRYLFGREQSRALPKTRRKR